MGVWKTSLVDPEEAEKGGNLPSKPVAPSKAVATAIGASGGSDRR
jgi:hypothetical protein